MRRAGALSLLLGVFVSPFAASLAQESREWRNAAGRPIKTSTNEKLVGTLRLDGADEPGKVRIRMGGKTFRFTLANLSEADQKYVAEQRAVQNGSQPTPAPKPNVAQPTRTIVSNPAPALAEDASRALVAIPKDGVKRALLVGVDDYAEFADLKYAVADVEAIRERLIELGFKPENIVELKSTNPANLRPSQRYIRRQVDALLKAAGPNDLLFLHFSGHGFQTDGAVRFAPEDAVATGDENVLDPETTISLTEIIERLKTSEAKFKWLIVDACRENPTGTRSAAANARALKNIDPNKGVLVLQSCAEGELSFEDADAGRGLFTGRLLEAFDGKADFDGDGAISALDVCKYVSEQTLAASKTRFNATQTPYFSGEFADFIVAEDLKVDGLGRADWARADSLYDEAVVLTEAEDYRTAQEKIDAALEIVAAAPETNKIKKTYVERQKLISGYVRLSSNAYKLFGKLTKLVSTDKELENAIKNANDGDVIEIAPGTYKISRITIRDKKITLVGATGDYNDVKLTSYYSSEPVLAPQENVDLVLSDLSLEASNETVYSIYKNVSLTATRCLFSGERWTLYGNARFVLTDCNIHNTSASNPVSFLLNEGSLKAENCDFVGTVTIGDKSELATLKNCKIHDCQYTGLAVGDSPSGSGKPRCDIIDSEIYDCKWGIVTHYRGQASVRNCEIHDCENAVQTYEGTYISLNGGEIRNCDYAYYCNSSREYNASNVVLKNIAKEEVMDAEELRNNINRLGDEIDRLDREIDNW